MSDTFTALDFEEFGVNLAVLSPSQTIDLLAGPPTTARTEEDLATVPFDFEVVESGPSSSPPRRCQPNSVGVYHRLHPFIRRLWAGAIPILLYLPPFVFDYAVMAITIAARGPRSLLSIISVPLYR
ncbi:hypothetical protein C8R45DRAFT_1218243 [Mycena sanguinolenta]|nr:hypothetical protein C8R45DRAFT_1218243 [Mycena sanguinolenta]